MKRHLRWIVPVVLAAVVVAVVGFGVLNRPAAAAYVTASATRGTVEQRFTASGSVERSNASKLTFDTPSTVTGVLVKVGDRVSAGQKLAVVDDAPLRVSLLQAQAQLAQAEAALDANKTAKANADEAAAAPAAPSPRLPAAAMPSMPSAPATTPRYLFDLRSSMARLERSSRTQQTACAAVFKAGADLQKLVPPAPTAAPSRPSPAPAAPTPRITRPTTSPTPGQVVTVTATVTVPAAATRAPTSVSSRDLARAKACTDALQQVARDELRAGRAIATASRQMAEANRRAGAQLQAAQRQMAKAAEAAAQQAARAAMARAQRELAAQAQRQLGAQINDGTLAADRARIVGARQRVERAQRDVASATMTSPISGTVGALDLTRGQSSGGRSITVVGQGQARVSVEVPLTVRGLVSTGTSASVGLVGVPPSLQGRVISVSVLPTATSGTPTYTASISTDDPKALLKPGTKAEVSLPLRTVRDVVTVPMSAVTKVADTRGTVQVVPDAGAAAASTVEVATGAIGGGRIEIVTGLEPGQLVVIADRRQPVPGGIGQYQARPSASPSPTATRSR